MAGKHCPILWRVVADAGSDRTWPRVEQDMTSSSSITLLGARHSEPSAERTQSTELNWILRAIPPEEFARLVPHFERVTLKTLEVLAEPGEPLQYAFFPESAIISVVR